MSHGITCINILSLSKQYFCLRSPRHISYGEGYSGAPFNFVSYVDPRRNQISHAIINTVLRRFINTVKEVVVKLILQNKHTPGLQQKSKLMPWMGLTGDDKNKVCWNILIGILSSESLATLSNKP